MEVIYSIGAKLAGGGIGDTAYHAVRGINRHGCLKKVICMGFANTEIPNEITKDINLARLFSVSLRGLRKIFRFDIQTVYYYGGKVYDYLASKELEKCNIFHGWNAMSLKCIRNAKEFNAITIVERASSHPITQMKLLIEEYKKFGIKIPPNQKLLKFTSKELEECNYITIPSDFVKESFLKHGFDESKLIQIPFGVDIEKFKPVEKRDGTFRAIFVGTVMLRKGIQYLLEAWNELKLRDAELLVCGAVTEEVKEIIKKYEKNKSIKILGHVKDVQSYYKISDIFVFPSIEEGSALVTYEAMACGLPVVVTFNTGAIARDGKDGFVIPIRDVKALKEKILYLYENPEEIRRMGRSARKHVERYTWNRYGDELVRAYEEIK